MNVLILYFSGTGNSKKVAEEFKARLIERKCSITLHSIEEPVDFAKISYDFLIVGFPKYYECPILYMLDYLKRNLPKAKNMIPVMAFCTQAGPLKTNYKGLERVLARKNHRVTVEVSFPYANNMAIFKAFKPTERSKLLENQKNIQEQVGFLLDVFLNGGTLKEEPPVWERVLYSWVAVLFTKLMPVFGMRYSVDESCTHCGLCAKRCPMKNIKMVDGKPVFGKNCLFCMRCINSCPKNSILYNKQKCWQYRCEPLLQPSVSSVHKAAETNMQERKI